MNAVVQFFRRILGTDIPDPVRSCEVYRDKQVGCVHVDGPLCDFPDCSLRRDYLESKANE